jgi:hypothetical protein
LFETFRFAPLANFLLRVINVGARILATWLVGVVLLIMIALLAPEQWLLGFLMLRFLFETFGFAFLYDCLI